MLLWCAESSHSSRFLVINPWQPLLSPLAIAYYGQESATHIEDYGCCQAGNTFGVGPAARLLMGARFSRRSRFLSGRRGTGGRRIWFRLLV
jgi:hypothetical protein